MLHQWRVVSRVAAVRIGCPRSRPLLPPSRAVVVHRRRAHHHHYHAQHTRDFGTEWIDMATVGIGILVSVAATFLSGHDSSAFVMEIPTRDVDLAINSRSGVATTTCLCQAATAAAVQHRHGSQQEPTTANDTATTSTVPATTTSSTSSSTSAPGSPTTTSNFCVTDEYDIDTVLGEGAYGMVYLARRKVDGKVVALKTMSRSLTGQTDFEREVAALQLLSKPPHGPHAHIVQLYDLHRDDDNYYLSMELIEGGELLEHLIDHGPYSEALAASFLRQFAEAICFVHDNGLAHADLKPENLLLSSDDVVGGTARLKVADFGCARSHDLSRQDMHLPAHEFAVGCSFLHMVALGNQFELEKMLQDRPDLVNFRDYDFRTPLHLAASEGHVDLCRFLVSRGARVNRSDRWGGSPLDDAHRHRHGDVIAYLRLHGATFGAKTQLPRFIQAAADGDAAEVRALLEFGNIDLDEGDYDRRTALHLAAGEGRAEMVQLLCQAGADVNVEDRWGNRPLDDAKNAKKDSTAIMRLLVRYGAKSIKNPPSLLDRLLMDSDGCGGDNDGDNNDCEVVRRDTKKGKVDDFSGTIAYWSPELFESGATPTPASDMWATGIIMFVLLTGSHPFDKEAALSDDEIHKVIVRVHYDQDDHMKLMDELVFDERIEGLSTSCVELMRHLLQPDPQKRMTSEQFLRHPWTQGLTASWTTMEKTHDELKVFWQTKFRAEILKKFAASLGFTEDRLGEKDLADIFRSLDIKKNNVLGLEEIQTAFQGLGMNEKSIATMFACADLDGTGVINFDEFRTLLMNKSGGKGTSLHVDYLQQRFKSRILDKFVGTSKDAPLSKDKLREIFNAIDLEGNGILDPHEIRVFLRTAGEPDDVISRIVASLDLDRNGKVSWDEFLLLMGMKNQ